MATPNIRIDIASEFRDRGFKQASKASTGLDRQFKKLARTFATVFSVTAVTRFGKQAVKAFEEDEAAARRLTQTLNNLGMAFEDPFVTKFVSDLEGATGVLDDQLRPAMGRLLTTTASFIKSQELLTLAIDVSRGSGVALETVVSDLSRAYVGQTRGLVKYGIGLTQAEIKTKSFAELQTLLNDQFGGQSQAFLETYSGKVSLLNVAYANMSETIGESLVDALIMAAGKDGIAGLTSAMEDFGDEIADVIRGVGVLLSVLDRIPGIKSGGIAGAITSPFGLGLKALAELGKREQQKTLFFPTAGIGQPGADKQREAIEKARIKREKELEKLRKKSAAEAAKREREAKQREREQQALKRAGTVFDMENIQIVAALQNQVTEDQRLRLIALLALNNGNAEAADKLSRALLATQAPALANLGILITASDNATTVIGKIVDAQAKLFLLNTGIADIPKAKNPFEGWNSVMKTILSDLDLMASKLSNLPTFAPIPGGGIGITPPSGNRPDIVLRPPGIDLPGEAGGEPTITPPSGGGAILNPPPVDLPGEVGSGQNAGFVEPAPFPIRSPGIDLPGEAGGEPIFGGGGGGGGGGGVVMMTINIAGNVTTENDLVDAITDALYQNQKTGKGLLFSSTAI